MLGLSDRGVVEAVTENPYLQYFIGFKTFQNKAPLDASLMTHFRKRLPAEVINLFNEKVITKATEPPDPEDDPPPGGGNPVPDSEEPKNAGTIMMDATCAPADIRYPTDLNLVNDARERTEKQIDQLRELVPGSGPRPRTRPQICRRRFLDVVKHPKCGISKRRKTLRFLLNAVKRNLEFIREYLKPTDSPSFALLEQLAVIQSIHDQQREMLDRRIHRTEHRIVNLQQPHVRPIVRGKAGHETEFGAKLTASFVDGYTRIERLSWKAYSVAGDLPLIYERFKERTGYYLEAVLTDKLFRNRENLRYCAERGIRLSDPRLGRPLKNPDPEWLKQELTDNSARNAIEGKFGQCKRRLSMGRVMDRLQTSSETVIAITILTANLIHWEQDVFCVYIYPSFTADFFIQELPGCSCQFILAA